MLFFCHHLAVSPGSASELLIFVGCTALIVITFWGLRIAAPRFRKDRTEFIVSLTFISAHEDKAVEGTVKKAGAFAFFVKPLDDKGFLAAVRNALNRDT